ncbi:MAG TPA: DUF2062 domain-containing protein [bacterium]|nr:DUF2062 domain-containing protein [bacterium]
MRVLRGIQAGYREIKRRSLKDKIRYIVSLNGNADYLAFSFAVGILIGLSPLYGLHTLMAVLAVVLCRLNLPTTLIGAWLNFPFIAPGVYYFCFQLGRFLAADAHRMDRVALADSIHRIIRLQFSGIPIDSDSLLIIVKDLAIGCTVVGIISAILGYVILRWAIVTYRNRIPGDSSEYWADSL